MTKNIWKQPRSTTTQYMQQASSKKVESDGSVMEHRCLQDRRFGRPPPERALPFGDVVVDLTLLGIERCLTARVADGYGTA